MKTPITDIHRLRPQLHRQLARSFPRESSENVQDAISEAFVALLEQPELTARTHQGVYQVTKCIAWRRLRARYRRRQIVRMRPLEPETDPVAQPGQEWAALWPSRLAALLNEATALHGGRNPHALREALEDRLIVGETDGTVARRHGVNRSALNRAKRHVLRGIFGSDKAS